MLDSIQKPVNLIFVFNDTACHATLCDWFAVCFDSKGLTHQYCQGQWPFSKERMKTVVQMIAYSGLFFRLLSGGCVAIEKIEHIISIHAHDSMQDILTPVNMLYVGTCTQASRGA